VQHTNACTLKKRLKSIAHEVHMIQ